MRLKPMLPIFSSVFMAELGDKTQLATILFMAGGAATAAEVFLASGSALVLSTFMAVMFGAVIARYVPPRLLKVLAGLAFVGLGIFYIYQGAV